MSDTVHVRPTRAEDLEAVAAILVEGFAEHFEAAFGHQVGRAGHVLARLLALDVPRGLPGMYVAELQGRVVGTIVLRRRGDPEASLWSIVTIFVQDLGLWAGLRAMFCLSLLDQAFGYADVYIADVAVAAGFRRRGVARALLTHGEKVARFWGKRRLVLDVGEENEAARQLYRQLGYTEGRFRRSLLARWLLGKGAWVRMQKTLEG